jgi:uncharacterized protein (DUF1800 family)
VDGGQTSVGLADPNAPLMDLIFPNRPASGSGGFEPTLASVESTAGVGPRVQVFRRRAKVTRVAGFGNRPVRRRRLLLGIGTGVVVAGAAGAGVATLSGVLRGAPDGPASGPSTADGLGAAGLADSPSAAAKLAAAATPTVTSPLTRDPDLHLLRRATFGITAVDAVAIKQMGVDEWLERQLEPESVADPMGDAISALYPSLSLTTAQLKAAPQNYNSPRPMDDLGRATLARQIWSSRQLYEVMVDFWANHLNVVNPQDDGDIIRSPYDRDVIRAYAFGKFSDMLYVSARHPAMLHYLNNDDSDKRSVNENYGRELLELHTVGLGAKYTEKDVRQSAYIMTGRTIDDSGNFQYESRRHWTGTVTVMGFTHQNNKADQGLAVGDMYLDYLALHPSTANRIAYKLARRFVCDDPPTTLVTRLAQSYLDSGSATVPVLRTLFNSVEFWMSSGLKTRRPLENVVATARILGVGLGTQSVKGIEGLYYMANDMGQAPLRWSPPDGYADYADAWGSAHATLGAWNAHRALVNGDHEGLTYPDPSTLIPSKPATVGAYLDALALRLTMQPIPAAHRTALLKFMGYTDSTKVKTPSLSGKVGLVVPLLLDSVYHTLR